jgi:hypothetical protein
MLLSRVPKWLREFVGNGNGFFAAGRHWMILRDAARHSAPLAASVYSRFDNASVSPDRRPSYGEPYR